MDEAQSSVTTFPGTSRIMEITMVAFVQAAIRGEDIFRLPHRVSATYVSERFVECVNAANLRGLEFNEVPPLLF